MTDTFISERITVIEQEIIAHEDALIQLGSGVQSYTLDTGQTRQTVTKADIGTINKTIDSLYNRRDIFRQRAGLSCGVIRVIPKW